MLDQGLQQLPPAALFVKVPAARPAVTPFIWQSRAASGAAVMWGLLGGTRCAANVKGRWALPLCLSPSAPQPAGGS